MRNRITKTHDGIVIKKNKGQYWVWTQNESICCGLKLSTKSNDKKGKKTRGKMQKNNIEIVVGDRVAVRQLADGSGQICELHPRMNKLARRAAKAKPGGYSTGQLVAANIDQLVAVMPLDKGGSRWNLVDRYLASAEALEVDALICLTKADVLEQGLAGLDEEAQLEIENYRKIGYRVLLTSAHSGEGMDELHHALEGKVSLLMGKSGAGKSSLINTLLPGIQLRTNEVNAVTGKGRHTTTGAEMYQFGSNGWLVDTAGTREFGLWDVDSEDMAWFFPEMRSLLGQCRFGLDCQHDEEPGCALRGAVMDGRVSPRRYFSMMKLKEEGNYDEKRYD